MGLLGASLIVVMPDGYTSYRGSQYLNSPAVGNYDDYLVQELVPNIDRIYRTLGVAGVGSLANSAGDTARSAGN